MKYMLVATVAAVIGGLAGSVASVVVTRVHAEGPAGVVEGREFILLDQGGKPTARLMNDGEDTLLRFYNADSTVALEVGAGREHGYRKIVFYGKDGEVRAALRTVISGDSSLFFRNEPHGTSVVLGALPDDIPTEKPTRDWGLQFQELSSSPTFSLVVRSSADLSPVTAGMRGERRKREILANPVRQLG